MSPYKLPATTYKLLVIVGTTSSGKSELAVQLAKRFNGEIVSADSRQVYKGMDLGTGKISGQWRRNVFSYKGVPHHLIDFLNPKRQYSAALFQRDAKKIIAGILRRGKLPIICGGTGHWIDAVVYDRQLPDVKPDLKLRIKLGKKTADELYRQLKKLDSRRAKTIDRHNKRRLVRALEIIISTGKPVPQLATRNPKLSNYQPLWLGINLPQKTLYHNISKRLNQRLKAGMVKEVSRLHNNGISWKRLNDFGLEYRFISLYLQKKLTRDEMLKQLSYAIKHYAKRQMTWWKKNKEIRWFKKPIVQTRSVEKFLAK